MRKCSLVISVVVKQRDYGRKEPSKKIPRFVSLPTTNVVRGKVVFSVLSVYPLKGGPIP